MSFLKENKEWIAPLIISALVGGVTYTVNTTATDKMVEYRLKIYEAEQAVMKGKDDEHDKTIHDLQLTTTRSHEIMKQLIKTNENMISAIQDLNTSTSSFEKVAIRLDMRLKTVESEIHRPANEIRILPKGF